ncbi:MAG: efflux transporter outer membrane subunit [Bryobacteraceae bacterium]|nr:efflux transporter outer membrane subunit [Bryobacteraceae bacterium]
MTLRAATYLAAGLLLTLAGCRKTEPYQTPSTPRPEAYKEALPDSFKEASKDWKPSAPADSAAKGQWWSIFHDPVLDALEASVDVSNQTLKSAEARFRQARALIRENRSQRLPTVTGGASVTRDRLSLNRGVPAPASETAYGDFNLGFDAEYEVDLWGRVRNLIAASVESAQATAADIETVRLSLHAELALDYFDLRSLDDERRILDHAVDAYGQALALTRRRFEGGVANQVEVAEAETQLEATRAQQIDIAERRAQYEHALAELTGQTVESFSLAENTAPLTPPAVPVGMPSALLERRPDIAAAERRIAVANSQVGQTKAAFFPTVMLGLTAGLEGSSLSNWFNWPSRLWALGPSAAQTLFDAGRRRAVKEGAVANYDATVAGYRQSVLSSFQQVEDNLASLRVLEDESRRQKRAVEAARRSETLSLNRYKGGLVTYLEVATAQTVRLQNERVQAGIERRQMEASVLLIKTLGGGWDRASLPTPEQLAAR